MKGYVYLMDDVMGPQHMCVNCGKTNNEGGMSSASCSLYICIFMYYLQCKIINFLCCAMTVNLASY